LKIVLDTNVLVSALLRPGSVPARVLDLVLGRQVMLALDHRIFAEYQDVLYRPEFMFPHNRVADLLEFLWRSTERVRVEPLPIRLSDPNDLKFLEVAVGAPADALVTGNLRHFPPGRRHGVLVLNPRQWLEFWAYAR
jgi:putative PIN family toxin of toxin-antitoxin system